MHKCNLFVSDTIIEFLRDAGVDRIYGAPGTSELSLMRSAARCGIEYFFTLHDSVAVGMADGFARAKNYIAVVNLHATQGLLNASGFIRVALRDNVPLLIIVCIPSTTYDIYEPNHFTLNLLQAVTPITRWSWTVSNIDTIEQVLNRAISVALSPPQGPTLVCIPQDLIEKEMNPGAGKFQKASPFTDIPNVAGERNIARAAEVIVKAQNPLIFAGHGSQHAVNWVETLADIIAAPIISESLDRGPQVQNVYCRSNHPLFYGFFDSREPEITEQIQKSDVVVFIGSRATYPKIIGELPKPSTVIEINSNPLELGKYHKVDIPLWGNIGLSMEKLCDHSRKEIGNADISKELADKKKLLAERIKDYKGTKNDKLSAVRMENSPITALQLIRVMKELLPGDTIIVDDSQCMSYYLKYYYDFKESNTLYGSMASHIGWALPAALGVKQAKMPRLVTCLVGDGSFMFGLQSLAAASTYRIPVLIIIADNRGFISLKKEIAVKWELNSDLTRHLSLDNPGFDYAQLSLAMGLDGIRVAAASDLTNAVKHGLDVVGKEQKTFVLDVVMSQSLKDWEDSWHVPMTKK